MPRPRTRLPSPATIAALLPILAGCGGTSTEPPPPDTGDITFATFAEGRTIQTDIASNNAALGATDPTNIPFAGSVEYQGTADIRSNAGLNAMGVLEMSVRFDDGLEAITGVATDFIASDEQPVEGDLRVSAGQFNRSGEVGGNLVLQVEGAFGNGTFDIASSPIEGAFYGEVEGLEASGNAAGFVNGATTNYNVALTAEKAD